MGDVKAPVEGTTAQKPVRKYQVKEIMPDYFFTEPVYLDKQFILAAPEMKFSMEMKTALEEWKFNEVYSAGSPTVDYIAPGAESASVLDVTGSDDPDRLRQAKEFYIGFLKYVGALFTQVEQTNRLDYNSIVEKMKFACDIISEERRFILRIENNQLPDPNDNYMASHAAKSTIISIIIGLQLKLPDHKLIELGVSAMLHEVGMIKLPEKIYLSNRQLEPDERKAIFAHPILGFNLLKSSDFPISVTVPILEHHERENGAGYPRKLTSEKISLNAKIIAVACSYEALSSQRPHKEAKDGFTGMMELLKNTGNQYDDTVVRALVFSLSLYPIGLYVLLSNGRKGQVVDVNPENPRFPVVQIFGESAGGGNNKTVVTSQDGIFIIRPLSKEETKD